MKQIQKNLAPLAGVEGMIHLIRGQKVMLDADLARLYGVETKNLNKAVKRNRDRFPADFMFQLESQEVANLRFQFGTSSSHGGQRYLPFVFTQEGIAMLSGVLNSSRAIRVNVEIMRAFVRMRGFLLSENDLPRRLAELEKKYESHDEAIQEVFFAIKKLMSPRPRRGPKREIGFHTLLAEPSKPK
jgi:ORF6N domain